MPHLEGALQKLLQGEKTRKMLLIMGAVGVLLLALPSLLPEKTAAPAAETVTDSTSYRTELEAELTRLVSAVTGEDAPTVFLTLEDSGSAQYAQDEQSGEHDSERTHVLLKSSSGGQSALLVSEHTPQVQGVVIVSCYAENAAVREKLLSAVQAAFVISSNRVCVVAGAQ